MFQTKACHVTNSATTNADQSVRSSAGPHIDQHRRMVTGRLAFALLANDLRVGHPPGQRR